MNNNIVMSKKKLQDSKFDWKDKSIVRQNSARSTCDISITKRVGSKLKDGSVNYRIAIIFKNNVIKDIAPSGYIDFAVYKNRVLFRESDSTMGLFVKSHSNRSEEVVIPLTPETKELEDFIGGDFTLKYDEFYEVFYIERRAEFKKYKVEV